MRLLFLYTFCLLTLSLGFSSCGWLFPTEPSGQSPTTKTNGTEKLQAPLIPGEEIQATVSVFFRQEGSTDQSKVIRDPGRPFFTTSERLAYSIETLLAGPNESEEAKGLYTEIPKGTKLLSVHEDDQGALRIDLSKAFTEGGGAHSIQHRFDELLKTIEALRLKQDVYIDIEGQELEVLGSEGLEVSEPIRHAG